MDDWPDRIGADTLIRKQGVEVPVGLRNEVHLLCPDDSVVTGSNSTQGRLRG